MQLIFVVGGGREFVLNLGREAYSNDIKVNWREAIALCIINFVQYIMHRKYTTYIKQDTVRLYFAGG